MSSEIPPRAEIFVPVGPTDYWKNKRNGSNEEISPKIGKQKKGKSHTQCSQTRRSPSLGDGIFSEKHIQISILSHPFGRRFGLPLFYPSDYLQGLCLSVSHSSSFYICISVFFFFFFCDLIFFGCGVFRRTGRRLRYPDEDSRGSQPSAHSVAPFPAQDLR